MRIKRGIAMDKKNVLLLGSGGREHALAWKLSQSSLLKKLYIAPGNPGTATVGTNIPVNPTDFKAIESVVREHSIDLVVVGPEEPLVKGLHDHFSNSEFVSHIPVIGPKQAGAMLEGSKDFAKQFMLRHGIPTAEYQTFDKTEIDKAEAFLKALKPPYVLKADGLAAGKGVVIVDTYREACKRLNSFFDGSFGEAGKKVVIEEFLSGIELSVFVLTDGNSYIVLPEAKDYKRIGEGDTGPNTGGMGAISPVPFASSEFMAKVEKRIIAPTVEGLKKDGIPYCGFLFIGLMNVEGNPYVIEYNVRMGDPETEVVMPRIESDLLELLILCASSKLHNANLRISNKTASTVMLVSEGYPANYRKGFPITIESVEGTTIFHAGTSVSDNRLVTSGGRVMACTATGIGISDALELSYRAAKAVQFEGKYYRNDIGRDILK